MSKFYGAVGFVQAVEGNPGVYDYDVVERNYYGDIQRNHKRWYSTENLNDNLNVSNELSIVADPYAYQHTHTIRYIKWLGTSWLVTSIDVQYPRLVLSIGGVYNGPQAETASSAGECTRE